MSKRRIGYGLVVLAAAFFTASIVTRRLVFAAGHGGALPSVGDGSLLRIAVDGHFAYGHFSPGGRRLVVLFHGNRAPMKREESFARRFHARGFSTLLVEYPGYGVASGLEPSEDRIYKDAEALIRDVQVRRGFETDRTVLWGRSLGSGVAAEMALRDLAARAILVTPFTSVVEVAEHKTLPWLPYLLVRDRFDTLRKAPEIRVPVLLIHGRRDTLTPFAMSRRLLRAFHDARLLELPGAGHFDIARHLGPVHWNALIRFAAGHGNRQTATRRI